ncbi:potassium channel family protein [Bacillus fonticola]|uniref:potassium channel family protein n=1 Tax=Bacillus fonticola TaxID=2728853 RepID=UPI001474CA1F|nr:potassium channel family protein [Bacillus fonticola]
MGWYKQFIRWPVVGRILLIGVGLVLTFGILIHLVEPETFPSIMVGIYWSLITASTVGFGDYAPVTTAGRVLSMVLILMGAGFISAYFIGLATLTVTWQNNLLRGYHPYKGKDHMIVIGWNERTRYLFEQMKASKLDHKVVLIDESLEETPDKSLPIHFVRGRPSIDGVLRRANLEEASVVLITSDPTKDELQADMSSILTLLAVKGNRPDVYCMVEILTEEQVPNAKRAGADEILETNHHASYIMANSIFSRGMSEPLSLLLDQLRGNKMYFRQAHENEVGKSFFELAEEHLEQHTLLIGYRRGKDTEINPPLATTIYPQDELLIICQRTE